MAFFSSGATRDKLMVLFFLDHIKMEVTRDQITSFFIEADLMPYFDIRIAVSELEEKGFIAAIPRTFGQGYCITPEGEETLSMFYEELPLSKRTAIIENADATRERMRSEKQHYTAIEDLQNGNSRVVLKAMENNRVLFDVRLLLPDHEAAKHACDVWPQRASELYLHLMQKLVE